MSQASDKEKFRIMLSHWMEHNSGHAEEFKEWAQKAERAGQVGVYDDIMQAARQMNKANEFLLTALERLKED